MTALDNSNKIILNKILMTQYSMALNMVQTESESIKKLKQSFTQLDDIKEIYDARDFVYKNFPKFKDTKSYVEMGVKFVISDSKNHLRILAWFKDGIICYDYV